MTYNGNDPEDRCQHGVPFDQYCSACVMEDYRELQRTELDFEVLSTPNDMSDSDYRMDSSDFNLDEMGE